MKTAHPRGLYLLFITEFWERFSFYAMRALLVFYMTSLPLQGGLGWDRGDALHLFGKYAFGVYVAPLLGGWLADKWLGMRRSVMIGGATMAVGHFLMAFNDDVIVRLALAVIALGNGFFKPCLTSILGGLYDEDDPRRDGGYSIFYMGINLGGIVSSLVAGYVSAAFENSYDVVFTLAGLGMVIGLALFVMLQRRMLGADKADFQLSLQAVLITVATAGLMLVSLFAFFWNLALYIVLFPILLIGIIIYVSQTEPAINIPVTQDEIFAIPALAVISMMVFPFAIALEQSGGMLNLFALESVNRVVMGIEFSPAYLQGCNPLFVILFAPFVSYFWVWTAKWGKISTPIKMALGYLLTALAFALLWATSQLTVEGEKVHVLWLILAYALETLGELCIIPVLWSTISVAAPKQYVSLFMALSIFAIGIGGYGAGALSSFFEGEGFTTVFLQVTYITLASALVLIMSAGWIKQRLAAVATS